MRVTLLVLSAFLSFHSAFSQNTSSGNYTRGEQITTKDCDSATDKNKCLSDLLGNAIADLTNRELRKLSIPDDTLRISIGFSLNDKGRFDKYPVQIQISNKLLNRQSREVYEKYLNKLPRFDIKNRRPEGYRSLHEFDFIYEISKDVTPQKVAAFGLEKEYSGGKIVMVPVFPGCENLLYQETINCFNLSMKQHITTNFQYPEEAYKNNIKGKVYINFIINVNGEIENIKTKGAAAILQTEAIRIIELLPKFKPALVDGNPIKIPFSIPINFNLDKY